MRTYLTRTVATMPVLLATVFAACADSVTETSRGRIEPAPVAYDRGMSLCTPGAGNPGQAVGLVVDPVLAERCSAQPGDIIWVTLDEVRPTQPSLGYDEVYYKLGRYAFGSTYSTWDGVKNKRFGDWCEASGLIDVKTATAQSTLHDPTSFTCTLAQGSETQASKDLMKTVVIGPHGVPFLTDGHHTLTSFWETADGGPSVRVRLLVVGNLSNLSEAAFWDEMKKNGWTWLFDANDLPINPQQLPRQLGLREFGNDPYRGALYFARDIGYQQVAANALFQEFHLGRWARAQTDPALRLETHDLTNFASYLSLTQAISNAIVALPDNAIMADGLTALTLGKLPAFVTSEFNKLAVPFDLATPNKKPGKLGYMLAWRNSLATP